MNRIYPMLMLAGVLVLPSLALADDGVTPGQFTANNVWMMLSAGLVFIMHLGFATLESGLTRAKNTTNILFKNTFIVSIGILTYALCGFNLMYPGDFNGVLGFSGLGLGAGYDAAANTVEYASGGYTYWTDFLFQTMFAATGATIVSGAVAERIKLPSFMIFSTVFVAIVFATKKACAFPLSRGHLSGWAQASDRLLLCPPYVGGQVQSKLILK